MNEWLIDFANNLAQKQTSSLVPFVVVFLVPLEGKFVSLGRLPGVLDTR
jgi:hypothetical protein